MVQRDVKNAGKLGWPDWKDAKQYPSQHLTLNEWRWEFLRRRISYRADYAKRDCEYIEESKGRYFERVYGLLDPVDPSLSILEINRLASEKQRRECSFDDLLPYSFDSKVRFVDGHLRTRYA